jgi:hypothetical protein
VPEEEDVGGRDDGSADDSAGDGEGGGRRCCLLLGDDRPGPRSRLSNPDSKVSLAAMDGVEFGIQIFRVGIAENNVPSIRTVGR